MTSFTVECRCGEQFHVGESAIGRKIACRRCGRTLKVARSRQRRERGAISAFMAKIRRHHGDSKATISRHPIVLPATGAARLIAYLVWAYLVAVLVLAGALWLLGDRAIPGTVLLFMGRWVLLLPLALLVPAALWLRRDLLLPLAIALVVVLGPIMGLRTGWRRLLPDPDGHAVRVVTYNVGRGYVVAHVLSNFLERLQPQVVAFQECGSFLAAALQRLPGWHHHASRDLCLLSRYPIREAAVMDRTALDRIKQSEEKEIGGAGYVVRFVLDGPRGPIRIGNLHLETPRKGIEGLMEGDLRRMRLNTEIRDVESSLARQWVEQGTGPLLVLGDFNTPVESRIFRQHWGHLANAFSVAGRGFGMTRHNGWIRVRIDHVLASDEWHIARAHVGSEPYSDHRPLIVDLILR